MPALWVPSRSRFFLPIRVLRRVFCRKFTIALKRNFRQGKLGFHGTLKPLAHPKAFSAWLRTLFRHHWHVYSKRPFGDAEQAVRYLGHYTHRVAISNHRLVSLVDQKVTFHWRDSVHNHQQKLMTLSLDEFLRRFLLHLLQLSLFNWHPDETLFLPLVPLVMRSENPPFEAGYGFLSPSCFARPASSILLGRSLGNVQFLKRCGTTA